MRSTKVIPLLAGALVACSSTTNAPTTSAPTATAVMTSSMADDSAIDPTALRDSAAAVLDDFHQAASRADEERYLGHMAPDGVFLGTAAGERWDRPAFRTFVHPYFSQGRGWTYRPRQRHIEISPDGAVAWFDEMLDHDRYGELRGTGVLRMIDGKWKIAQYNLTFTIPNDVAADVVERIRQGQEGQETEEESQSP